MAERDAEHSEAEAIKELIDMIFPESLEPAVTSLASLRALRDHHNSPERH